MSLGEISNLCYSHLQNKKFNLDIFTHAPLPPPTPHSSGFYHLIERIFRTIGLSLAAILEPLTHC